MAAVGADGGADESCDIAIVGGGMVGATLSASIAQGLGQLYEQCLGRPLSVAVIEREKVTTAPSTFDLRSIVLSRSTVRFLHQRGWWADIAVDAMPIETVAVERANQFGRLRFTAAEAQVPALGYVIANQDLGKHLWHQVRSQSSVCIKDGFQLIKAEPQADGWLLSLADTLPEQERFSHDLKQVSKKLSAKLMVVADGANSATLTALGVATQADPYGQSALVLGLADTDWAQNIALERFLPAGNSVAVLPRGDRRLGVVVAGAPEDISHYHQLPEAQLLEAVAQMLGRQSSGLGHCVQRGCYPLVANTAQEVVRANLLVVGNAAQTLHPIAGQGFNLAVRDLATFLQILSMSMSQRQRGLLEGKALLPFAFLERYASERAGDRARIKQFCHQLLRAFASDDQRFAFCRQLGMTLFDTFPAGKAWLAHSTLAPRVGPQPAWATI